MNCSLIKLINKVLLFFAFVAVNEEEEERLEELFLPF